MTSSPRIEYLAAYIDGEGCLLYDTSTRMVVNNTYPHTLYELQERFGGTVKEQPQRCRRKQVHRTLFRWTISGEDCRNACRELLPYLREKQPQAKVLLLLWDLRKVPGCITTLNAELKRLKRIDYGTDSTN